MSPSEYIVTLPPPTPNGSLHVGHMAGPFLAADAFVKARHLEGVVAVTTTYSDANQSYVKATAQRLGLDPGELADRCGDEIHDVLLHYGCDVDAYRKPDAPSAAAIRHRVAGLVDSGALKLKAHPCFYSRDSGRMLTEAEVSGFCPNCLDRCKWGICEGCAMVNDAASLLRPIEAATGSTNLDIRPVEILVLEVERSRPALESFYEMARHIRPRYQWLAAQALGSALPDFPVSVPGTWGIRLDDIVEGQVLNPWAEVMFQLLICYQEASHEFGISDRARVVNFFGFDNSYFYAIPHIALLDAMGEMGRAPYATMINEFYNLDHSKFSTSQGHVVWAADIARRFDPDLIRFYLALTGPGFERANFNEAEMQRITERRITNRWRSLAAVLNGSLTKDGGGAIEPSARIRAAAMTWRNKVLRSLGTEHFHMGQAAEDLAHIIDFIDSLVHQTGDDGRQRTADAIFLVRVFAHCAYPIMPGVARRLADALAIEVTASLDEPLASPSRLPGEIFESRLSLEPAE